MIIVQFVNEISLNLLGKIIAKLWQKIKSHEKYNFHKAEIIVVNNSIHQKSQTK